MTRSRLVLALLFVIACSTRATWKSAPTPRRDAIARIVRVSITPPPGGGARIGGTLGFTWEIDPDGRTVLDQGRPGEEWRIERETPGARVRAVSPDDVVTPWQRSMAARPGGQGFVTVNGKRYRGDISVIASDSSYVVVNRLDVEDYLRGVVPLEMGARPRGDSAALQAQAVASRSYALLRATNRSVNVPFDLRASTADQVYGGVDAENDVASAAIDATVGLVLLYDGRLADAPFHSTCGGTTAEATEVWRNPGAPYLRRVSDRIPGSDRYYCDIAPRFRWERTLMAPELNAALAQYLKSYADVPGGDPGVAKAIGVRSRTASGFQSGQ